MMAAIWFLVIATTSGVPFSGPDEARMKSAAEYSASKGGRGVVVMFDGKVVFEHYHNGGSARTAQMLASGSKSFVGVAAIAAVEDGLLKLDDPASRPSSSGRPTPRRQRSPIGNCSRSPAG